MDEEAGANGESGENERRGVRKREGRFGGKIRVFDGGIRVWRDGAANGGEKWSGGGVREGS